MAETKREGVLSFGYFIISKIYSAVLSKNAVFANICKVDTSIKRQVSGQGCKYVWCGSMPLVMEEH